MGRIFTPAKWGSAGAPEVESMVYATGQTFLVGAVLIYSSGEVVEGGADPTGIVGVALEAAGSKPGYGIGHSPTIVTGRVQEVSVAKANRTTVWSGRGTTLFAVAQVGVSYGIVKSGNDWIVDITDTTNLAVRVVGGDVDNGITFFKFLEAAITPNP